MSIDLTLGFRQKPEALGKAMASMGFALDKTTPVDATYSCKMESYNFFDAQGSRRGVRFVYHDGTYKDHAEFWQEIVDDPEEIVATASVEAYMHRSAFDLKKQMQTAKYLRDHYDAVLYDPQTGQVITD